MELKPEDIVISSWSAMRKSGGSVTPDSGIQLVHQPTGAMVQVDTERSQHANKAIAMKMLEAKVETLMEERARPPAPFAAAGERMQAWDADATTRLRSIVDLLGLQSSVPDGDLTGYEFSVLGFVRREIERLRKPAAAPVSGDVALPELPELFAEFCEREGYPSDGPFDAALRKAFDAGFQQCSDAALERAARCIEDFQADKGTVTFTELSAAIRALKGGAA